MRADVPRAAHLLIGCSVPLLSFNYPLHRLNGSGPLQLHLLDDDPEEWRELLPLLYPRMNVPRLSWVRSEVGPHGKQQVVCRSSGWCSRCMHAHMVIAPAPRSSTLAFLPPPSCLCRPFPCTIAPTPPRPPLSQVEVRRVVGIAHKYDITLVLGACERFLNGDGDKVAPAELSAHRADPNYVLAWLEVRAMRAWRPCCGRRRRAKGASRAYLQTHPTREEALRA